MILCDFIQGMIDSNDLDYTKHKVDDFTVWSFKKGNELKIGNGVILYNDKKIEYLSDVVEIIKLNK